MRLWTKVGDGYFITKNFQQAVRLWTLAAEQGHPKAQTGLGICYFHGHGGITKDFQQAVRLWTLAAEQGHPDARYNLGICYFDGKGVQSNHKEAVRLWTLVVADQHRKTH
jgi:TPR repeat protein